MDEERNELPASWQQESKAPMTEIRQWQNHQGFLLDSVNGFDVIECETCGFKHIVPIPTQAELEAVYRQEYYSIEKPLYLERHREDLDWWNLVYSERYDTFEGLLPPDRRRVLDVGSGPGFFLLHGQQRGWQTLGIEPSAQAAAHSRKLGLEIVEDFLTEQMAVQLGKFDVVHMSEVLEHIPDPRGMLQLVRHLLTLDSLLCVVTPNDYNPFQHALRTTCNYEPWWIAPPHHINYFGFDSLRQLFTTSGFDVILNEATFPIDMFLLMGDNYVKNDSLGQLCHSKRMMLERNLAAAGLNHVKRQLYRTLAISGLGREVVLVGAKKG